MILPTERSNQPAVCERPPADTSPESVRFATIMVEQSTAVSAHPCRLDVSDGAWWVQEGRVEVFAQSARRKGYGRRAHLATLDSGCLVPSVGSSPLAGTPLLPWSCSGLSLSLTVHPGTRLRELSPSALAELSRRPEVAQRVASLVDDWIRELPSNWVREARPELFETLEPGSEVCVAERETAFRVCRGVVWVRHLRGSSCFLGRSALSLEPGPSLSPISTSTWLTSAAGTSLLCLGTADLLLSGRLWTEMDRFHALFLSWLAIALQEASDAERSQMHRGIQHDRWCVERSHARLVSVLEPHLRRKGPLDDGQDAPSGSGQPERACPANDLRAANSSPALRGAPELVASPKLRAQERRADTAPNRVAPTTPIDVDHEDDPLLFACRLVGKAQGLRFSGPPDLEEGVAGWHRLSRIASASRVRHRRVLLRGDWWRRDNGPLLGFLAPESRDHGATPVALLPVARTRYELVQPWTGDRYAVDGSIAERLQVEAAMFYPPLPRGRVGAADLARLALRGRTGDLMTLVLAGAAGGLLALLVPLLTSYLFGTVIPASDRSQLLQVTLALVMGALAAAGFQVTRAIAVLRLSGKIDGLVQTAVWDRLMALPTSFFRKYSVGDLADRALGLEQIREVLTGNLVTSCVGAVFSLFSFALLFYYSRSLALLATVLVGALGAVTVGSACVQLRHQRELSRQRGKVASLLFGLINGIAKIRVAGAEHRAYSLWADRYSRQRRSNIAARRIANLQTGWNAGYGLLSIASLFAMVVISQSMRLPVSDFLAFVAAFGQFQAATFSIVGVVPNLLTLLPSYERLKPILVETPEVDQNLPPVGELSGELEVHHVSFRYDDSGPKILEDVSFRVRPGGFIALVGPSGAGKSTCLRLILGFERPEIGSICFDGEDLRSLDLTSLRRQIGVVLQGSRLMSGNLFTNIVGSRNLTTEDAWKAIRMAGLEADLEALPMGLHTVISEDGNTFSGGQIQRILIARAIVHQPKILLFDEATNALDNATQDHVIRGLESLESTRIVIAHRLSTIRRADWIYVMEKGRVVEEGCFEELRRGDGLFSRLARRQLL